MIRGAVEAHDGVPVRTEGDAMFAAFGEAGAAVSAAIEAQRALATHAWPQDGDVRVRMGLHTGEAHLAGDDYGGFDVNRAARIAAVGHGEQIVLSETTRSLVESALPAGVRVRDLGRHALKDIPVAGAPVPARRPRVAHRVPAGPGRPVVRWQPARPADDVRRAFGRPRRRSMGCSTTTGWSR